MNVIDEQISVSCHHCGDACPSEPVIFENQTFCCYGCRAVYELIATSQLTSYYDNEKLKVPKARDINQAADQYASLDISEIRSKFIRYEDESIAVAHFHLTGIHCSSCIYLLEHLPKLNAFVQKAEVNFIRKDITVSFQTDKMKLSELASLLASLGYPPRIQAGENQKSEKSSKGLVLKLAVAGFCFGNSMLISLPEYFDVGFQLESHFKSLFGFINLILAIPLVFYAASTYFRSSFVSLKNGFLNIDVPISLGILVLFGRSLFEILTATGPGYIDSLGGLIFFLLIGKWYQERTYQALSFDRDFNAYFPLSLKRKNKTGDEMTVLKDLSPGDEIILHNQELIPADGIIVSGNGNLDYSFVTGESELQAKRVGEKVFAGGRQVGGQLNVVLEKTVNNSELTQLWNHDVFTKSAGARIDGLIDGVSKYFTIGIIVLAIGTGWYWYWENPELIWSAVSAVLIVACPCALALAMPFGLGHGMRQLGKIGLYLKNAQVIERIADADNIIFDKTGTLTRNDPHSIGYEGQKLDQDQIQLIKSVCTNSAHPLSKHIARSFGDAVEALPVTNFHEVVGKGISAEVNGQEVKVGSASFLEVAENKTIGDSKVYIAVNGIYCGYFTVKSGYRTGIFSSLERLKQQFQMHLLSGDNASEYDHLSPYFHRLSFDQSPADKLDYVKNVKGKSMMLGDGLNDAGALKAADVGVAVCEDVHQFSPACDMLMNADAIVALPKTIDFSRGVMWSVKVALVISLLYNVVGLSFAVSGHLTPVISAILMPVSSITVVGFITLAVSILSKKRLKA